MPTPLTEAHKLREMARSATAGGQGKLFDPGYIRDDMWSRLRAMEAAADQIIAAGIGRPIPYRTTTGGDL